MFFFLLISKETIMLDHQVNILIPWPKKKNSYHIPFGNYCDHEADDHDVVLNLIEAPNNDLVVWLWSHLNVIDQWQLVPTELTEVVPNLGRRSSTCELSQKMRVQVIGYPRIYAVLCFEVCIWFGCNGFSSHPCCICS